jgi:hypothetical protein
MASLLGPDFLLAPKKVLPNRMTRSVGNLLVGGTRLASYSAVMLGGGLLKAVNLDFDPTDLITDRSYKNMLALEDEIKQRKEHLKHDPERASAIMHTWILTVKKMEEEEDINPRKPDVELIQDAALILLVDNDVHPNTVEHTVHNLYERMNIAEIALYTQSLDEPRLRVGEAGA